mgnify:FL=1
MKIQKQKAKHYETFQEDDLDLVEIDRSVIAIGDYNAVCILCKFSIDKVKLIE